MAEQQPTLTCVLLTATRIFTLTTDRNALIRALKELMKTKLELTCAANLLKSYQISGVL